MGGSTTISTKEQKLGSVRIQTSAQGLTLPIGYGCNRVPGNLIWYNGFKAVAKTTTTSSGGKGGGVEQKNTTYTYYADAIMALGEGPWGSVENAWKGKDKISGSNFVTAQTCVENLAVPSTLKVRLSFYAYYTSLTSVVLVQDVNGTADATLTLTTDYTVSGGIITIVNSAYAGRTIRVTYTWTPSNMLSAAGALKMSFFGGSYSQATWSFLASSYSTQALPYSCTAYVAAQQYLLNSDASFSNHNFEINFKLQYPGRKDANPADVVTDLLTNPDSGAQFPAQKLGDLTLYSDYCRALGLFLSPVWSEQQEARNCIDDLLRLTNSAPLWSEGLLKIIPYGDANASGNGATYTPNVTPVYHLTEDDFLAEGDEDPILVERKTPAEAYNQIQLEYVNRANAYNVAISERKDQASIEQLGLRMRDPIQAHSICDETVAGMVAQLLLQRELYVRNKYRFKLGWKYCLLEPMDIVSITDTGLGYTQLPVRIIEIQEDENGKLSIIAEDFPAGAGSHSAYGVSGGSGYQTNFSASPGSVVAPVLFESPIDMVPNDNEIWCAVSGTDPNWGGCTIWYSLDNVTYKKWGVSYGARYGSLELQMTDQPGQLCYVKLTGLGGQILAGTAAEANANATLCWVDGEYMSHEAANLISTNRYSLQMTKRGVFNTMAALHAGGSKFVRVDEAVARVGPFDLKLTGQTFYFKFTSFNVYGNAEQELADVSAYTYTVTRDVSTDNLLTPPEKPGVILEYNSLNLEQVDLDAQATALGIAGEKELYDAALRTWREYLATLNTPVPWNNLNGNTTLPY